MYIVTYTIMYNMGKAILPILSYRHKCVNLARNMQWRENKIVEYHIILIYI